MPKYRITMSDTVTYTRVFTTVKTFRSEEAAEAWGEEHRDDIELFEDCDEDQTDNTPWEIEVALVEDKSDA